jgi:pimeloyl-ACP methyl ester carboxylesterase
MRAREPDRAGFVERDGVHVAWELFDRDLPPDAPTVFLLPTWAIVHSRFWKGQVPFLARRYRVLTLDNRGNGRSDRPVEPAAVTLAETVHDCIAAMDASDTPAAVVVGLSSGGAFALRIAALFPERVLGAVFVGPSLAGFGHSHTDREEIDFEADYPDAEGWRRETRASWLRDWPGYMNFFIRQVFSEPHSTKQIEDAVGWALETTPEVILADADSGNLPGATLGTSDELAAKVRCPVLVVHGADDRIVHVSVGEEFAAAVGGEFVRLEGSGHNPLGRDPVRMNLLIRDFVERVTGPVGAGRAGAQPQKRRTTS